MRSPGVMGDNSTSSRIFQELAEIAKGGIFSTDHRQQINFWLKQYNYDFTEDVIADFLKVVSLELTIAKGAGEPEQLVYESVLPPPSELLPKTDHHTARIIREIISLKDTILLEETLRILDRQNKLLPPWALPYILDFCQSEHHLHKLLDKTMGMRGDWLSGQKQEWKWWLSVRDPKPDHFEATNLLSWIHFYKDSGIDLLPSVKKLSTKKRIHLFSQLIRDPHDTYESIARTYLKSQSASERSHAYTLLIRLDTAEHHEMAMYILKICRDNIQLKSEQIKFSKIADKQAAVLSTIVNNPAIFEDYLKDSSHRLMCLFPPQTLFQHIDIPVKNICHHLINTTSLLSLYQITICSASHQDAAPTWIESLCLDWINFYPEQNTTKINMTPLWQSLSYELYQKIIEILLRDSSEYFIEKLTLISAKVDHYIRKDLSNQLVEKLFNLPGKRINRRDNENLCHLFTKLQYSLDPRVNNSVNSNWIEPYDRQDQLYTVLLQFKNKIRMRSELLTAILNSKI